jgi:FkbM family methyltransferase
MDGITKINPKTYAQNHEDIIIGGFFPDVNDGFYVDVGANDPLDDSVTKLFYDAGWHGINLEPIPRLYEKLQKSRPRDLNLNIGVSSEPGFTEFREYHEYHGLSTMVPAMQEQYQEIQGNLAYQDFDDYKVSLDTLANIFKEHKTKKINFLKVDVEGYEYEVLLGNDWKKYRPELICIEANHIINDWRPILEANKYHFVITDGLNNYYLAEESLHRRELFPFPKTLIAGSPVLNAQQKEKIRNLDWQVQHQSAESRVALFQVEREFQAERYELHNRINILTAELVQQRRFRKQALGVLRGIDRIMQSQIEKMKVSKPTIYGAGTTDFSAEQLNQPRLGLLKTVRLIDAENYYHRFLKQPVQLKDIGYTVTRSLYMFIRRIAKFLFKKSIRVLKRVVKISRGN